MTDKEEVASVYPSGKEGTEPVMWLYFFQLFILLRDKRNWTHLQSMIFSVLNCVVSLHTHTADLIKSLQWCVEEKLPLGKKAFHKEVCTLDVELICLCLLNSGFNKFMSISELLVEVPFALTSWQSNICCSVTELTSEDRSWFVLSLCHRARVSSVQKWPCLFTCMFLSWNRWAEAIRLHITIQQF